MATKIAVVKLKQLIINADDFGRHELINLAVERAVEKGCVRSASIMAGGKFFEGAVKIARRNSKLGVGVHFTLANGNPILPPAEIPSLVTEAGTFHENYIAFLKLYVRGKISNDEVKAEMAAQLEKITRAGLKPTHFDSHQHLHHLPGIIGAALDLATAAKIPAMRVAGAKIFEGEFGIGKLIGRLGLGSLAKYAGHLAHEKKIATPEHFSGIVAGEAVSEKFLAKLIENLREGTTELMTHIGTDNQILRNFCEWEHDFEAELAAVTSPAILKLLAEKNIAAVNFAELKK